MFRYIVILLIFISSNLFSEVLSIDEKTSSINILNKCEILLDRSRNLTIEDIKNLDKEFEKNDKTTLSFGYSPNFDIWIKFGLKNISNKSIKKIIEYNNPLTTNIIFYQTNKNIIMKDGLLSDNQTKSTIDPIFIIELDPYEEEIYYIKASSYITTLIVDLKFWDEESFLKKEVKHQIVLSLFFGAMLILGIYNLFIFLFTKDISYLFYVIYIFGLVLHHLMYTGVANIYFLNYELKKYTLILAPLFVAIPVYALGLFTKSFLQTIQYKKLNYILNIFLIFIPISVIFFLTIEGLDRYRNSITMLFLVFLMIVTIYAALKKNKQAYFILFGWFIFLSSGLLMYLSSAGIFNITKYFSYIIEISFVSEAIIFSVALANRITNLQKEKNEANQQLINQKENETKRLTNEVNLRTKDLKDALNEKELLLKELNHRVKNNMQTIVSLIRLQSNEIENEKLKNILITIQNRIGAMGHLHELLYKQDNINYIDVYEYFELLVEEVRDSYNSNINIDFNIKTKLKMEHTIYCGLIINELITNSFKYAFPNSMDGNIVVNLEKVEDMVVLTIKDDGVGFDETKIDSSLGLILVKTLAINQLKGEIKIKSLNGVNVIISWNEND